MERKDIGFLVSLIGFIIAVCAIWVWATGTAWMFGLTNRPYPYIVIMEMQVCPKDLPCYDSRASRVVGSLQEIEAAAKAGHGYKTPTAFEVATACDQLEMDTKANYPNTSIERRFGRCILY